MDAPPAHRQRDDLAFALAAFAGYCALTAGYVLLTKAPLHTHFIGDGGDNWEFAWNPWWIRHCLRNFVNPYFCPLLYAPDGVALTMHNLALVPTLAMIAIGIALPMPLAYNVVLLSFFPVAGISTYGLARYITRDRLGAFVAGVMFMLCPFLTSKTLGHLNLLGAAFLPLYTLCLLRALDAPSRWHRTALTLVFLLIVFTNEHTLVFAANITVWLWLFRAWPGRTGSVTESAAADGARSASEGLTSGLRGSLAGASGSGPAFSLFRTNCQGPGRTWKAETLKFWHVFKPAAIFSLFWAAFLAYYAVRYGAVPYRTGSLSFCPEPLNFILPLYPTSIWRAAVAPAGQLGWDLSTLELAVYLGWLLFPLAVAGYCVTRTRPLMKFMGILFIAALVLALGPKLQWHRELVRVLHYPVYLPMRLYAYVPVLGSVGQSGRYLVIGYMAMAVALAGFIAWLRTRRGTTVASLGAVLMLACVGLDYGCRLPYVPVPECPIPPGTRRVLDVRHNRAPAMYLQTLHGRPLIGGYLARYPNELFARYAATPAIAWFFMPEKKRGALPQPRELRADLQALDVEYVCADRAGAERPMFEHAGLEWVHEDALGVTFRVPP